MNALPAYIDSELWDAFWDMRKKMGTRAPITDYGKKLILKELMKFHAEGYDANNSLEQSIMKGWRGVFQGELRSTKQSDTNPALTAIVENSKSFKGMPENIRAQIARLTGKVNINA
jgi:hypothetical protein